MIYRRDQSQSSPKKFKAEGGTKKRKKRFPVLLVLFMLLLAGAAAAYVFVVKPELGGESFAGPSVTIEVPEGSSTGGVAQLLNDAGVIGSVTGFKIYCRLTGADGTFQYGKHEFASGDYKSVIATLQQPAIRETFTITFPEGYTTLSMAQDLEKQGVCTVEEFLDACAEVYDVSFFSELPGSSTIFIKLEGYLYPDTYEFYVDSTPHEMIQLMLENFEKKVLTDDIKAQISASGRSLSEIMTLASIIQKEAFSGEEYNVSSVFNNRLAEGSPVPRLESDTTWYYIYYVLDYYYGGAAPQELRAAYDSYSVEGFIAGPICNPGVHTVDAALNPSATPYYYFLTDNNKKFYYAETVAQHEENKKTMEEVNAALEAEQTADSGQPAA